MYDKDILKDDFMGEACLFPNAFSPNVPHTINLELQDGGDPYLLKKKKKRQIYWNDRSNLYV